MNKLLTLALLAVATVVVAGCTPTAQPDEAANAEGAVEVVVAPQPEPAPAPEAPAEEAPVVEVQVEAAAGEQPAPADDAAVQ